MGPASRRGFAVSCRDGGGSIRIPAHFTGIAGLKPTPGRVSAAGHVPEINHPGGLLGVGGPMARIPSKQELYDFISAYYRVLDGRSGSPASRIREAVNAFEVPWRLPGTVSPIGDDYGSTSGFDTSATGIFRKT